MRRLLAPVLILACLLAALPTRPALALPPLPSSFYGTVTVDGASVPPDTLVSAWIGGVQYAAAFVVPAGSNTVYSLNVPGDDPGSPGIDGGREGDVVVFKIGEAPAEQTGVWHSGTNAHLDLTRHVAGIPAAIALHAVPAALIVGGPATSAITATVKDALGGPVPQITLQGVLDTPGLGALVPFGATDAAGQATSVWTAGTVAGYGLLSAGTGSITASLAITLANPLPQIADLSPKVLSAGSLAFSLTVTGTHFVRDSCVHWNGQPRPSLRLSDQTLAAAISKADVGAAGSAVVAVVNGLPGGGTSNSLPFSILPKRFQYLPLIRR